MVKEPLHVCEYSIPHSCPWSHSNRDSILGVNSISLSQFPLLKRQVLNLLYSWRALNEVVRVND